ncbi:MAG: PAS domain S-box protein [Methanoregula sp.]|nr:PAS domain S-box protein [Methanoregula sp.]
MKLQKKSLLVFVALLILVLIGISVFFSTVLLASYSALEEQYVEKDLDQAVNKLNDELFSMSSIVSDWGPWDDTVDFVNGNDPNYLNSNLQPYGFDNLNLNIIVITDTKGKILFSGAYDLQNKVMVAVPAYFSGPLDPKNPLMNQLDPHKVTLGILMLSDHPMLVVSQPIVHSDYSGPPRGVVIMGRYLNKEEISRLAELTQPSLSLTRIDDPALSQNLVSSIRDKSKSAPGIIRQLNMDQVAGYALIRDIYGNDALVLEITEPREIYRQGIDTTVQVIIIILSGGLFLGLFVIYLLDHVVLNRMRSLAEQVNTIGKSGSITDSVVIAGDDELSGLATEINRMLKTIEHTQQDVLVSEARFRELAELLPLIIFEMDTTGVLTYVNRAGVALFGVTEQKIAAGINIRQFLSPDNIEHMQRGLSAVMSGAKSPGEIYTLKQPDGNLMRAIVSTSLIHREGRVTGFRGIVIDISERIRLEEALTESEEYLQSLIWSIRVGIIVIDVETHTIIDVNPAALEMMGTTKDVVINQLCHKAICPAEVGRCPITDLDQTVDNAESILLTQDCRAISIIKYVVPVMLHGKPCLLETFIDNTYRKQIELKLAESEEKYRALTENTGDILFSMDMAGIFTYISPQVNKYGFLAEEIIGKTLRSIIYPEDLARVENDLSHDLENGAQFHSTFRILDKWGHVHWFDEKGTLRLAQSGKPLGIYGVLRDDSERKRSEETLTELKNQYMAIFDNTGSAMIIIAKDTSIVMANQGWAGITGIAKEAWTGRSWTEVIYPEDLELMKKHHSERREDPVNVPREYTFRLIDTSKNIHHCLVSVVMIPGTTSSIAAIVDISERTRAEEAVELANKKLNLMNNITRHDILNTITGLLGCVDMANATTSQEERMSLLRDIKDLTRIIQRQIAFTKEYQEVGVHLPLWQNVNMVISRIRPNFEHSGLQIHVDLENTEIYADPLLEKVFYNLVDNALRYGETITTISFYFLIADKGLSVICEDDGAGVSPEEKTRIFERGVGKNTGMGLFLTREILGITGITITENGVYGKGARFEIQIPRGTFRFIR